jgi:hypothetical protein
MPDGIGAIASSPPNRWQLRVAAQEGKRLGGQRSTSASAHAITRSVPTA